MGRRRACISPLPSVTDTLVILKLLPAVASILPIPEVAYAVSALQPLAAAWLLDPVASAQRRIRPALVLYFHVPADGVGGKLIENFIHVLAAPIVYCWIQTSVNPELDAVRQ